MELAKPAGGVTSGGDAADGSDGGGAVRHPAVQAGRTEGLLVRPSQPGWERLARQTAHWGLVTAGRPVHRARMLPSFLIVGAERCGTTSLWDALRRHPAVFSAVLPRKELHYFDYQYQHGLAWYQSHFPFKLRASLAARRVGAVPVAFEASPYYMFHPLAPQRIHHDLPGVRVLAMLRDPAARAYSAYFLRVGRGYETEPFERALELEASRLAGEADRLVADPAYVSFSHRHFAYRTRGQYAEQLEQMEKFFGRDRIHVVESAAFFANPAAVYDEILDFLGLPHHAHPPFERPPGTRSRPPMPDSVRRALAEHYRPYDERLTAWLGHEPSWRR
jgi:hypothetical protein